MFRYRTLAVVLGMVAALATILSSTVAAHAAQPLAAVNQNCTLIVPAAPLTAVGLSTPYRLVATNAAHGPCNEANANQSAFVQAAIFTPSIGGAAPSVSVYNPVVVDQGTMPAAAPVVPVIAAGSTVGLWFGFNGQNLRLMGTNAGDLRVARCVNGVGRSLFGQFAYCNAPAFFAQAKTAMAMGTLVAPALGIGTDGAICPTVRDFSIVDQDQSDNVTTTYLINGAMTAQNNATNRVALPAATVLANPSDNRLLTLVDAALGCTPWMAPDLANPGVMATALPLNELQAFAHQAGPVALVPNLDPMVLVNGHKSLLKRNLYRIGVGQNPFDMRLTTTYCRNMRLVGVPRILLDKPLTLLAASPDAAVGNSLFTFIASRFETTFGANGLNCVGLIHAPQPIIVTRDGAGVAISAVMR